MSNWLHYLDKCFNPNPDAEAGQGITGERHLSRAFRTASAILFVFPAP